MSLVKCREHPMGTVLKIVIEAICAAVVIYIVFRETFEAEAREFEARTAKLFHSVRRTDSAARK